MSLRLYIAGPMTGLPDLNYPAFHKAENDLLAAGYRVENPAHNTADDWLGYMRLSLVQIARSDGLVILPGFQDSRGATIELNIFVNLDLPVDTVENWVAASDGKGKAAAWAGLEVKQ